MQNVKINIFLTKYFLTGKGQRVRQIDSGNVADVRLHSGVLFCVSHVENEINITIRVYDSLTWQRIRLIQSPCLCKHYNSHTLHVGSEQARIQKMLNRGAQKVQIIRLNWGHHFSLVCYIRPNRGACAGCAPSKSTPGEYITIASRDIHMIHAMTHNGDLVHSVKHDGYPHLCHTGSDAMFVAELLNHRLRLQHDREWSHVQLEPHIRPHGLCRWSTICS